MKDTSILKGSWIYFRSDKAMREPPQPDVRKMMKDALKLPETTLGRVGLGCLIIVIVLLAYFTP